MMPCDFTDLNGQQSVLDLDAVIDVVDGWSGQRVGWQAFVIYEPNTKRLVELQSTVPDVRGNSADEAIEVTDRYVIDTFGLTEGQLARLRRSPEQWTFIRRRI